MLADAVGNHRGYKQRGRVVWRVAQNHPLRRHAAVGSMDAGHFSWRTERRRPAFPDDRRRISRLPGCAEPLPYSQRHHQLRRSRCVAGAIDYRRRHSRRSGQWHSVCGGHLCLGHARWSVDYLDARGGIIDFGQRRNRVRDDQHRCAERAFHLDAKHDAALHARRRRLHRPGVERWNLSRGDAGWSCAAYGRRADYRGVYRRPAPHHPVDPGRRDEHGSA